MSEDILNCEGYRKLEAAVKRDEDSSPGFHDYRSKLRWAVARARHYAERTGLTPEAILDAWEQQRDYWYMNFYQDATLPEIKPGTVRVFDTVAELRSAVGTQGFRCPHCGGVSKDASACDSGAKVDGKVCDWKVYGLFRDLGKGITVFVKDQLVGQRIFMPVAWEQSKAV